MNNGLNSFKREPYSKKLQNTMYSESGHIQAIYIELILPKKSARNLASIFKDQELERGIMTKEY